MKVIFTARVSGNIRVEALTHRKVITVYVVWKRLLFNEDGQGMAEYVFILALVAVAAIFAFDYFGSKTYNLINRAADNIQ